MLKKHNKAKLRQWNAKISIKKRPILHKVVQMFMSLLYLQQIKCIQISEMDFEQLCSASTRNTSWSC